MIKIETIVTSLFEENCYLVSDEAQTVVIDPGSSFRRINSQLALLPKPVAILLTHGHFDHLGAVDSIYHQYHCAVYAAKDDKLLICEGPINQQYNQNSCVKAPINWLSNQSQLNIGSWLWEVYYVPGHTEGSVAYKLDNNLFSGDTLFYHSIGRTDLYGGSDTKIKQSLKLLTVLDPQLVIWPGHGEATTLWEEQKNNPYL